VSGGVLAGPAAPPARAGLRRHRAARRRRGLLVTGALAAVVAALLVVTMTVGSSGLSAGQVVLSLLHLGDDPAADFIVRDLRLPTALTGLLAGAALGLSGVVFQRLLANPLASPDFVGVTAGANLFGVAAIVLFDVGTTGISLAALAGAVVSAALVYVLAWRDGVSGYRFILIGIGISEFMLALVGYLVVKADLSDARAAMTWLVGSVGQAGDGQIRALGVTVAVLLPVALLAGRRMRALELGDDAAAALGAPVERSRLALLAVSIVLIAMATAAVGPVMFVALMAGPIAVRLLGPAAGLLAASALVGAAIVLAADIVALHAFPFMLPTGVVTGAIGAPYLVWLLATANRAGRGG
jgi:iron complex transport system permease protein